MVSGQIGITKKHLPEVHGHELYAQGGRPGRGQRPHRARPAVQVRVRQDHARDAGAQAVEAQVNHLQAEGEAQILKEKIKTAAK